MASDGGPEYDSHEFRSFLQRWGVRFRKSSANHPSVNGQAKAEMYLRRVVYSLN